MNTLRFNVFNQIHKGLRAFMFDTVLTMQQTDFCDTEKFAPVLEQTELLLEIFDKHAYHEDTSILSAAEKHAPALIAEFEGEHETDMQLTNSLRQNVAEYKAALAPEEKYTAGYRLYYALNDFVAFNLKHMNKEEQVLNQVLWQHYSDNEILAMEYEIQQNIAPDKVFIYFKWMIRGINDTELLEWLTAVRNGAPDFVFNGLLQECRANLPQKRWTVIETRLVDCAVA